MERNAVIELAVASEATKGVSGSNTDDQDGNIPLGLAQD
ncbi:hypothetical protein [Novosphingobium terrae]